MGGSTDNYTWVEGILICGLWCQRASTMKI